MAAIQERRRARDGAGRGNQAPTWRGLPRATKLFVSAVVFLGGAIVVRQLVFVPTLGSTLFFSCCALAFVSSMIKVRIPIGKSVSTVSIGNVVSYMSLVLMGPHAAVLTGAIGALGGSTFRADSRNPVYRTAFNVSTLALSMWAAGAAYATLRTGGAGWEFGTGFEPLIAAAFIFFLVNTTLVAGVVALSTKQTAIRVWTEHFAWTWLGNVLGAILAGIGAAAVLKAQRWPLAIVALTLLFTYNHYKSYVRRFTESIIDPLTQIQNVRFLSSHVQDELARSRRSTDALGLLVIDVDDFKRINDTHGHTAGDRALRAVAQCLKATLGTKGICARYGGDEFVAVLSYTSADEAASTARALQSAVGALVFRSDAGASVRLSVSIGVALSPADGRTLDALLSAADRSMFSNKACRRDRSERRYASVAHA